MKYNPRRHGSELPADAVTENAPTAAPRVARKVARNAALATSSSLSELAFLYEREVFDFVRNSLDAGRSESQAVADLMAQNFDAEESRTIVRAVIEDRRLRGIDRQAAPPSIARNGASYDAPDDALSQDYRKMMIGLALIAGGVVLTLASAGTRFFFGAVLWGIVWFFQGLISSFVHRR
jgi:hypothetical protein